MMSVSSGARIGWYGGAPGGSLWMLAPCVAFFFGGKSLLGLCALGFIANLIALVFLLDPSKHPGTRMWKLFLPIYAVNMLALSLFVSFSDEAASPRERLFTVAQLMAVMLPQLFLLGSVRVPAPQPEQAGDP